MSLQDAERAVRDGDLDQALSLLQAQVKQDASSPKLRIFLFQLLCVMGQWDRARTQLDLAADLDAGALALAQMYRETIQCERLRMEVFSGKRSPVVFGQPDEWLALLIEAMLVTGTERAGESDSLRARAFGGAPATAGAIDDQPFEWIADADMRLGPVCEAVINGRYYWIPFDKLARIDLEAPADLRDFVWMPAHFMFQNGGESVGVIPTRYPGSENAADPLIRLGRKTTWEETRPDVFFGLGQRVLTTDAGQFPLMDVRVIQMGPAAVDPAEGGAGG
jgi:type VI secretion system protein ImpE